ncbi:MAG: MlaD family protein [Campylobacterota bacterium]|nr:MlaD family protein [Campylobacterota bacterium]
MESKVSYTLVGLFVALLTASLVSFIFWMGKYGQQQKQFDYYTVYTSESVSGLNIQSPVKFKGLEVGVVKTIQINPHNSEEIKIKLEIKKDTPIKIDTLATVALQGITGLKYIELLNGLKISKRLEANENGELVIQYGRTMFDKLGNSAQNMATTANQVLNQLTVLFNEKNLKSIENILSNLDGTSSDLKRTLHNFDRLMAKVSLIANAKNATLITNILSNVEQTSKNVSLGTQNLDELMNKDLKKTLHVVQTAAVQTQIAFNKFEAQINEGKLDLKGMTSNTMKKMDTVFMEFERAMQALENTLEHIEENPSNLLFKNTQTKFGPGENTK